MVGQQIGIQDQPVEAQGHSWRIAGEHTSHTATAKTWMPREQENQRHHVAALRSDFHESRRGLGHHTAVLERGTHLSARAILPQRGTWTRQTCKLGALHPNTATLGNTFSANRHAQVSKSLHWGTACVRTGRPRPSFGGPRPQQATK